MNITNDPFEHGFKDKILFFDSFDRKSGTRNKTLLSQVCKKVSQSEAIHLRNSSRFWNGQIKRINKLGADIDCILGNPITEGF